MLGKFLLQIEDGVSCIPPKSTSLFKPRERKSMLALIPEDRLDTLLDGVLVEPRA